MKWLPLGDRKFRVILGALAILSLADTVVWLLSGMPNTGLANLAFFADYAAGAISGALAILLLPISGARK